MWFAFDDGRYLFHSPGHGVAPFVQAADRRSLVAVMVETFDPSGCVMKVRATGPARREPLNLEQVVRIYDRYLSSSDAWEPSWEAQARDSGYVLWSVEPTEGSAVQFPQLHDAGGTYRWRTSEQLLNAIRPP